MLRRVALVRNDISEECRFLKRAKFRNVPEDVIIYSPSRENVKSYKKKHVLK
jgi:signal recognition particle subunit SEC65